MTLVRGLRPFLFCLLSLGLASCGSDPAGLSGEDAGSARVNRDVGVTDAPCADDNDCPFGQVCRDQMCALGSARPEDQGCWVDDDCMAGFSCAASTGRCVADAVFPDPPPVDTATCAVGNSRRCGTKIGACEYGQELCVDGNWSGQCEGGVRPQSELCDGLDNDCQGSVDESFVLGVACSAGVGVCEQTGVSVCAGTGTSTVCSVLGLDPTGRGELCGNNLDDDCDSEVDEDFVLNAPCTAGVGACERAGFTACSSDGSVAECSATPGSPASQELCGGAADDNCNGQNEEGFESVGLPCSAGVGACLRAGAFVCTADQLGVRCSASAGPAGPQELCGNTVDENCDGQINEGFGQLGQSCTVGTPPCQATGTWTCSSDGTQLECQLPVSSGETCNGADDDGDSCIDEDFDVGVACSVGVGICANTGVKVCNANGTGTVCNATPLPAAPQELCGNGLDDDCDTQTDEGFPAVGQPCTAGQGICQRGGSTVCTVDGLGTECDATPGAPMPAELCGNSADDDCNGQVDEGFLVGAPCTVGQGICERSGQTVCTVDGLGTQCSAAPGPAGPVELCGNGLDDNCNGQQNEGFNIGLPCTEGAGICQAAGNLVCTADMLGTECNANPGTPLPNELCGNGLDDDCDTFTDEGFTNVGNACTAGQGACASAGTVVCTANLLGTQCDATPGTPTTEVCDGIDNDCNTVVDNGCDDDDDDYCDATFVVVGTPAVCPLTIGPASLDCNDLNAAINPGAAEICNDAVDQNCDGNPSEGCPVCNPGIDADFDGANECMDCDETNGAVYPGATEDCDGVDNDCDTLIDEGFDVDGDGYTTCGTVPGLGGLDVSLVDCDDTDSTRFPGPASCELCALSGATVVCGAPNDSGNGVDEDCDGYVDENCSPCDPTDTDGDGVSECNGDCAPGNGNVSPNLPEACDGQDTDCNATTTENCAVGDSCNWPGAPPPDECGAGLLCVESLGPSGQASGNFTCTSFCNGTPLGLGLGDGCEANQTCAAVLTPTANLHGCAVSTDIGPSAVGAACSQDIECRSSDCLRDQRATGPPQRYCSDLCGNNSYCGNGTTCQVWGSDTGRCWQLLGGIQTRGTGVACNDTTTACQGGPRTCTEITPGNRICSEVCCTSADCPNGYHCSSDGTGSPGPVGGYDTVPVCWPDATGAHDRPAGAACTSNGQCISEFCDQGLNVCVDLCCNNGSCPNGLSCEDAVITRRDGNQTIGRVCVNISPSGPLVALP